MKTEYRECKNEHYITTTVTSITFSCNYEHYLVTPITSYHDINIQGKGKGVP